MTYITWCCILPIFSMITLMAFMISIMITLVMLIIIIVSQVLGHTSCVKYAQKINHMDMLSMNKVTIK